jgi:hypothetical protein
MGNYMCTGDDADLMEYCSTYINGVQMFVFFQYKGDDPLRTKLLVCGLPGVLFCF